MYGFPASLTSESNRKFRLTKEHLHGQDEGRADEENPQDPLPGAERDVRSERSASRETESEDQPRAPIDETVKGIYGESQALLNEHEEDLHGVTADQWQSFPESERKNDQKTDPRLHESGVNP